MKSEIEHSIHRVLQSGRYILGEEVENFEHKFAEYVGIRYGIGVASGTEALMLALRACGVGQGDIVFTVSHTSVATISAIESVGAMPALLDIDRTTFTLSPASLEEAVSSSYGKKAKAVIPVHLYGHPAAMQEILKISKQAGLFVVEDCAQAHGAKIHGRSVGTWGDSAAFSFYPTKNLGGIGDSGIVVTNDEKLADRIRILRQYGWQERNISVVSGYNSRMDEMQAAILLEKLPYLDSKNQRRRDIAHRYNSSFRDMPLVRPQFGDDIFHVFHQYVLRLEPRDDFREFLRLNGIETLVHYPRAIHQQPAYSGSVPIIGSMEETNAALREIVSLPMFPELTESEIDRVVEIVTQWQSGR